MRKFNVHMSIRPQRSGAAALNATFAALFIGVAVVAVSGATAASEDPPADPPTVEVPVSPSPDVEPATPQRRGSGTYGTTFATAPN